MGEEEAKRKPGVCPLRNFAVCIDEDCAWWVPKHGHCAVCYIAEVAMQVKNLRTLLTDLVEIRDLLKLPTEK